MDATNIPCLEIRPRSPAVAFPLADLVRVHLELMAKFRHCLALTPRCRGNPGPEHGCMFAMDASS